MSDLGALALRLSEATDVATAADRLAEHARALAPDAAVRVYLLGPGDRCNACPRAADCNHHERCFHLEAALGEFSRPSLLDQRVPRTDTAWGRAYGEDGPTLLDELPPELQGPGGTSERPVALLLPMEAGGETVGVLGLRIPPGHRESVERNARIASFLTATSIRLLRSLGTANRRFEQLLLVNELGRKVNAILNDELLLRQAAVDIHRTFGFHNVMIFMVDETRSALELRAQASRYASPVTVHQRIGLDEGIIGRVYRGGRTVILDDVAEEPEYVHWFGDTRSELAVAIQIGGTTEGVLNVESDRVAAFGPSDRLVLETVANQLAIAIENARLFGMLKEREDRYRTLVESSPGAVMHLDTAGRLIYANPAVMDMMGYEKAQFLSRFPSLQDLADETSREEVDAAVSDALRGVPRQDLEFQVVHADGGVRSVSAALQPLVGEHGDPKGVVVLALDRTREKQLQDQLNQSEKLSAIGTLVSGVAHELNNPLAGILGFAQLLLARPPEDWSRTDIEHVELNARRCQRIVENLLAFARQSRMTKRRANVNQVIDSVLNLNQYQFRMDNVEIQRDFDSSVPSFPIDVNRWQQVIINIASNAHHALLQVKDRKRRLRISTRKVGDTVEIRLADNGPGIPPDARSSIFDPFFTTKESGTGLGLGICFGIVEEHGGSITLEDTSDEGTTFLITLPIADCREYKVEAAAATRQSHSETGRGRRVLIVDDDEYVCDVVERVLQNHAYETRACHSGEDALGVLQEEGFDVVLTDVRMPGDYDGIDLYERLLRADANAADRVVFMTGNMLDARTTERLEQLTVRCVQKPFDIHALAGVVHGVAAATEGAAPLRLPAPEPPAPDAEAVAARPPEGDAQA